MLASRHLLIAILFFLFCSSCAQTPESRSISKGDIVTTPPKTKSTQADSSQTPSETEDKIFAALPPSQTVPPAAQMSAEPLPQSVSIISRKSDTITSLPPAVGPTSTYAEKPEKKGLTLQRIQQVLDEALDFLQAAQDFWQKGELDNAIEALDQAYALILIIDAQDTSDELMQQKEDLRFTISKRILEIYASRNIVVNGKHNAIPLTMNHHIKSEIHLFTKGREKEFFLESYKRSGKYRTRIVKSFWEAGLPTELSWLPLIESGFKFNALSRARALGLWQFIPSTGYKFGLKRDYYIDERLDPEKSTQAAIAYLKELHQIFGDWTTVLAAYNCGEGKVLRIIRTQNVNYLDNFWDLYERLPRETARYVPRFLATLHILKNPKEYGLENVTIDPPLTYENVPITQSVHLRDVAKKIGESEKTMRELNSELRYKIVPPGTYALRVPINKKQILLASLDDIPIASKPKRAYISYRVRRGDTLGKIAKKYHTSIKSIERANRIHRRNYIVAGQKLKIPQSGVVVYRTKTYKKTKRMPTITHVVKGGDSLWNIAKRYGTTTKQIQHYNGLRSARLRIGQVLKIPKKVSEITAKETFKTYRVRRGDSPFRIAKTHNMELERFLRINRLTPRSKIYPGQDMFVE